MVRRHALYMIWIYAGVLGCFEPGVEVDPLEDVLVLQGVVERLAGVADGLLDAPAAVPLGLEQVGVLAGAPGGLVPVEPLEGAFLVGPLDDSPRYDVEPKPTVRLVLHRYERRILRQGDRKTVTYHYAGREDEEG